MVDAILPPKLNSLGMTRLGGGAVELAASACLDTANTSISGVSEVACLPTASMSSQSDLRVPRLEAERRAAEPGVIRASDRRRCRFTVDGASSSRSDGQSKINLVSQVTRKDHFVMKVLIKYDVVIEPK